MFLVFPKILRNRGTCGIIIQPITILPVFFLMVSGHTEMPDAMETIFQSALGFGKHGGVSILFSRLIFSIWQASLKILHILLRLNLLEKASLTS